LFQTLANVLMGLLGLGGRGVPAGADRPHRLVGDDEIGDLRAGDAIQAVLELTIQHLERLVPLAFLERLADAHDRRQLRRDRRDDLAVDHRVGLAEQPPALGVADDHELRPRILDHGRRHLAGERAFALPVDILRRDGEV
jgi:hypothetical protein